MKKAFTLIELLIVITVMATLMTIMFKLGAVSQDESKRIVTITRLQKIENCLSGYFSAFGSYPPVKVYGSRDIYCKMENGVQTSERNDQLLWPQIEAACRSQPVSCAFPFAEGMKETVEEFSEELKKIAGSNEKYMQGGNARAFQQGFSICRPGDFSGDSWNRSDWQSVQIFKFGLLSYLLPRYLVMMVGNPVFYGAGGNNPCAQWSDNNDGCVSATDGREMSWRDVYNYVERNSDGESNAGRVKRGMADFIQVANMPTQAVCANWMANLEKACYLGHSIDAIFGVNISCPGESIFDIPDEDQGPPDVELYSPGGSGRDWYMLDTITVRDGWLHDYYYYAPAGAQSYTLWSAGPNGRTFPPWADKTGLLEKNVIEGNGKTGPTVAACIADDIIRMNH